MGEIGVKSFCQTHFICFDTVDGSNAPNIFVYFFKRGFPLLLIMSFSPKWLFIIKHKTTHTLKPTTSAETFSNHDQNNIGFMFFHTPIFCVSSLPLSAPLHCLSCLVLDECSYILENWCGTTYLKVGSWWHCRSIQSFPFAQRSIKTDGILSKILRNIYEDNKFHLSKTIEKVRARSRTSTAIRVSLCFIYIRPLKLCAGFARQSMW